MSFNGNPQHRHLHSADPLAGVHAQGRFDRMDHAGRTGLRAASIHGLLHFPHHTVAGDRGTLTMWVLPLEHTAPVAPPQVYVVPIAATTHPMR